MLRFTCGQRKAITFEGMLEIMSSSIYTYQYPHMLLQISTLLKKEKYLYEYFFASFQHLPGQCQQAEQVLRFVSLWFPGPTVEVRRTCTSMFDDSFRVTQSSIRKLSTYEQNYYCHETQWAQCPCCSYEAFTPDLVILLCTLNFLCSSSNSFQN